MKTRPATAVIAVILLATAAILSAVLSGVSTSTISAPYLVKVTCDGTPSDSATLQRAINASRPGAVIYIQGGTCMLTHGISLLGDRTYTGGVTTGTVLQQDARMAYVLASAAYVGNNSTTGDPLAIRDLTVACDGAGGTDGIIVLNWQVDVDHVDVSDCGGSGIVDTNTTENGGEITNDSVNSRFDNNFITNSGQYGFEVQDSGNSVTDGYLDDNQIAHSGKDSIHLDNAAGWNISGNHLYSDGQDGINANRLFGTTISNNYIEDFGAKQRSGTWYGIVATVQGDIGSTIFSNKVFNRIGETAGARYVYIGITQTDYGTGYLSVTGNLIVGVHSSDVGFSFNGGSNKLIVVSSGNQVVRVGTVRSDGRVTVTGGT